MANSSIQTAARRTLAIAPGTREMGYAVLEGTELLYFGVHTFKHRRSAQALCAEGQQFMRGLMDAFTPQVFVIEQTEYATSKRSTRLHIVVEKLQRFAMRHGCTVLAYTPTVVKRIICGHGQATKREVAETLIRQRYPYLAKYLTTDLRTREMYWQNMFDAVALGLTGCEDVSTTRVALTESTQQRGT